MKYQGKPAFLFAALFFFSYSSSPAKWNNCIFDFHNCTFSVNRQKASLWMANQDTLGWHILKQEHSSLVESSSALGRATHEHYRTTYTFLGQSLKSSNCSYTREEFTSDCATASTSTSLTQTQMIFRNATSYSSLAKQMINDLENMLQQKLRM